MSEGHFCVVTGVRHVARTPSVCVNDGHDDSRGTVQRDNTRAEQNGGPQQLLPQPSRSELPAIWADISIAIQGFKDCSTTRLVLDEVLGLKLSNFARLLKLRPGVDDDHLLVQQVAMISGSDKWITRRMRMGGRLERI